MTPEEERLAAELRKLNAEAAKLEAEARELAPEMTKAEGRNEEAGRRCPQAAARHRDGQRDRPLSVDGSGGRAGVAFERWEVAKGGGDFRREDGRPAGPTFGEAAEAVIAMHEPTWRSRKSGPQWRASLETYAYPTIGHLPVSEVTPGHVMAVLQPIWSGKRETARRVKQRISAICRWAVAQGHRTDDPAGVVIDAALPRTGVERRHMPALPYDEVADCIARVKASRRASRSVKLALEFLVLTAARSAEVRKATWDEIDLDWATWPLPAERMKANREHRVPLSGRALEVLAEAAELSDGSGLVFPGMRDGRPISENIHAKLLRELGFDAAPTSSRKVCSFQLPEMCSFRLPLTAYARSDLFDKRRAPMEECATYLVNAG